MQSYALCLYARDYAEHHWNIKLKEILVLTFTYGLRSTTWNVGIPWYFSFIVLDWVAMFKEFCGKKEKFVW